MNVELPDIFWSRWNQATSAENVRFLTGVQRVTAPSCAVPKFGSQAWVAPEPGSLAAKAAEYVSLAAPQLIHGHSVVP